MLRPVLLVREGQTEAAKRPSSGQTRGIAMHRTALVIAAICIALAGAAAAEAMQPTVETTTVHRHFVFPNACGSFSVIADFDAERRVTTFYDQDGTPIRRVIHAKTPGSVTNSVTGASLPAFGERIITTDLLTGAITSTGTNVHVVVPGAGTVEIGAGRSGIDDNGEPFATGRMDGPTPPALCDALAAA